MKVDDIKSYSLKGGSGSAARLGSVPGSGSANFDKVPGSGSDSQAKKAVVTQPQDPLQVLPRFQVPVPWVLRNPAGGRSEHRMLRGFINFSTVKTGSVKPRLSAGNNIFYI